MARTIFAENAPLDQTVAYSKDGDFIAATIRSIGGGLYAINTRKGSYEVTARTKVTIDDASKARDAKACKEHGTKLVTPSGALYCRPCSVAYIKERNAKVRAGEIVSMTPEERAAKAKARQEALVAEAAQQRVERLMESAKQGIRRTEAFFVDCARKNGAAYAMSVYGRYLTDERMDALVAEQVEVVTV